MPAAVLSSPASTTVAQALAWLRLSITTRPRAMARGLAAAMRGHSALPGSGAAPDRAVLLVAAAPNHQPAAGHALSVIAPGTAAAGAPLAMLPAVGYGGGCHTETDGCFTDHPGTTS
jgi:hypothetical protein